MIKTILLGLFHMITLFILLVLTGLVELVWWVAAKFLALIRPILGR
jgi:hypothetical protein